MHTQPLHRLFKILTVLLVVVPSLLIMAIYTVGQISVAKQKNLEIISERVAFQEQLIEYWMTERAETVRELSQTEAFRTLNRQQMTRSLELKQKADKNYDSLSYIDKDGIFRLTTLSKGISFPSAVGRPYYQAAQAGQEYISDVVIGRNSGQAIINVSSPIYDSNGNFQGLILGSLRTKTLETLLRAQWIGQTGEILLVDREGNMLAEPRQLNALIHKGLVEGTAVMKYKITDDAFRNIRLGESGSAVWNDYMGSKVLGAYLDVPARGWTLIGKIDEAEVLTPIYKQLAMMAFGTMVLVLLMLPLAKLITNQITKPIEWLIGQSQLVAAENYEMVGRDIRLEKMPHELGNLCKTFTKMSRKIANTVGLLKENEAKLESKVIEIQEINVALEEEVMERQAAQAALETLNTELESRVHERTSELQNMNATLEEEIAERQAAQDALTQKTEELRQMAYFDMLTGLPNRLHINERLDVEMEKARRSESSGAVLFIDLDDLKMINDTFGHTSGDALITMAGSRIVREAGESAVVGRIGGDEFMVIMPGECDRQRMAYFANKIIGALRQDAEVMGTHFPMSASAGIAVYPGDGDTAEEILKNADNAMYAAKKAGKNGWRFYEAVMQTEAYDKILLINSMRQALFRGEFLLHYQPQVRLSDGVTVGFEALLRWNSPEHGSIPPNRFIPLAEQSGIIQTLGKWVLQEACQFVGRLAAKGQAHITIAVNVSPYQLCADDFIDTVREALHIAGIEPHQLEIEITENALIASLEDSTRKLNELQAMGVRLSLDDFGTGYSSLTYLQRLPVKTLKIDKAFIDTILTDGHQKTIIGTIVDMAHSMAMTVVAEGVETESQIEYLAKCRCDRLQGYIISRPIPEDEAVRFLVRQV